MANDRKQGFLSSLFGRRKLTEQEEAAELESKQRLEERIQQALAERAVVPLLLAEEENHAVVAEPQEAPEEPVELFPISASVIRRRKDPVPAVFVLTGGVEETRSYASRQG